MLKQHNPLIDLRYWVLISFASVFGTNTGDLAVRLSKLSGLFPPEGLWGLRHSGPLPFLMGLFILLWWAERKNQETTELYFWSAILIIRTAATNIADMLAGDLHLDMLISASVLGAGLTVLAILWQSSRAKPVTRVFVPQTTSQYWLMMVVAGILGTIVGDWLGDNYGVQQAALWGAALMIVLVLAGYRHFLILTPLYWLGVSVARVAGTDVGDWLARSVDRGGAGLDLPTATVVSGFVFIVTALFWRPSASLTREGE